MSFVSIFYLIFCGITIALYFLLTKKIRWIALLIASIIFYCSWGIGIFPYIVSSILITYLCTRIINKKYELIEQIEAVEESSDEKKKIQRKIKKECKGILILGTIVLIGLLVFSKVYRLFSQSFIVPIGISYYTLSLVGYMADVYWKKIPQTEKNPFKLVLYAMYFPKILQGPICKYQNIAKQLFEPHDFEYERFCFGMQLMLWGYFKKLVLADRLQLFVHSAFSDCSKTSGSMLLLAAIFGAFQLYCDFSGCMNIAEGFSEILGIKLEKNFNHPFFSETAAEFWRRWHITLGVWFKDYIYMPLVVSPKLITFSGAIRKKFGKRVGKSIVTIVPLSCVWLLTGLWHGTGWNYIVWGCFWGVVIILSSIFEPEIRRINVYLHIPTETFGWHLFRKIRTFGLFVFTRIITITDSLDECGEAFKAIFTRFNIWELFDGTIYSFSNAFNRQNYILVLLCLLLLLIVSFVEEKIGSVRKIISGQAIVFRWICYYGLVFSIIIFGIYGAGYDTASFIYMKY